MTQQSWLQKNLGAVSFKWLYLIRHNNKTVLAASQKKVVNGPAFGYCPALDEFLKIWPDDVQCIVKYKNDWLP